MPANKGHAAWCAKRRAIAEQQSGSYTEDQRKRNAAKALAFYHAHKDRIKPLMAAKATAARRLRGGRPMRATAPRNDREIIRELSRWNSDSLVKSALRLEAACLAMATHDSWLEALDDDVLYPLGE